MKTLLLITMVNTYSGEVAKTSHEFVSERDCYSVKELLIGDHIARTRPSIGLTTIASCIEKD